MKKLKIFAALAAAAMAVSAFAAVPASAAETYHAYLGVQEDTNWKFRNAWTDPTYGRDTDLFAELHENGDTPAGGSFVDAEITGDGTYSVSMSGFDFGNAERFSQLFVSTDIPLDAGVTISDVKITLDGQTKYTFDEAFLSPDEKTYMFPYAINIWNPDLGGEDGLFGYVMPTDTIEISFTVSGMGAAGGAADTAADSAPASDGAATTSSGTGNASAAVMLAVMGVAGTTALVSKKRK